MEMRIRIGTANAKIQQAAERRKARLKSPDRYCFVIGSDYSCHINSNYINETQRTSKNFIIEGCYQYVIFNQLTNERMIITMMKNKFLCANHLLLRLSLARTIFYLIRLLKSTYNDSSDLLLFLPSSSYLCCSNFTSSITSPVILS
jgi:hypothetical protein